MMDIVSFWFILSERGFGERPFLQLVDNKFLKLIFFL